MSDKNILLVEDNPDDEELSIRALKTHNIGNQLIVVRDGAEALKYLFGSDHEGGLDASELPALVLLDLKLPKVDGLEVLRQIRAHPQTKRLPVVVLTCSNEDHDLVSSYDEGANSYIRKPIDFHRFSEAVRQLGLYWLVLNELPSLESR